MKVEILASNAISKNSFQKLGIEANKTYKGENFSVWEIEKKDLRVLEESHDEELFWQLGWWVFSKGSNFGKPFDFLTINNQFLIGWEAENGNDTFDKLTDYLSDGLGITDNEEICGCAVDLARANGMSMSKLFKTCEG